MMKPTLFSWADGEFVPTQKVAIPVASDILGTIRGYRIFTAARTVGKAIFRLDDHIERLFSSAEKIAMEVKQTPEELKNMVLKTVALNRFSAPNVKDFLIEIVLSGGAAKGRTMCQANPASVYILVFKLEAWPEEWYQKGVTLSTFAYQRQWPEVKLLNYVGAVIAYQTVAKKQNAQDVLFISPDDKEMILEGSTFNFFAVNGTSTVITPALDGRILAGITRGAVIELASKNSIPLREEKLSLSGLRSAKEAFLTSSTRNILPVVRVDDIWIGEGRPGPVTSKLSKIFIEYMESFRR